MYSSRLFNSIEQNYTTTKREALAMVYALQNFWHYLLGNKFTFFVDHMVLIYLVNKPHVFSRLANGSYYFWNMISKLFTKLVDLEMH
jgi:hypothetical protein